MESKVTATGLEPPSDFAPASSKEFLDIQARKANVPSHLHIFRLNFDKPNHCFPNPFLLLGETDFQNNAAYRNE